MNWLKLLLLGSLTLCARENPFVALPEPEVPVPQKRVEPVERPVEKAVEKPVVTAKAEPVTDPFEDAGKSQIKNIRYAKLLAEPEHLHIKTRDQLKKHFAIVKPTRILIDFDSLRDLGSRKAGFDIAPFREVRSGAHKGFYRVVVELTEPHGYAIEKTTYGYRLDLK